MEKFSDDLISRILKQCERGYQENSQVSAQSRNCAVKINWNLFTHQVRIQVISRQSNQKNSKYYNQSHYTRYEFRYDESTICGFSDMMRDLAIEIMRNFDGYKNSNLEHMPLETITSCIFQVGTNRFLNSDSFSGKILSRRSTLTNVVNNKTVNKIDIPKNNGYNQYIF